jgi:hypothetical protein
MFEPSQASSVRIPYIYNMKNDKSYIDAIIDKLTNSIENSVTGDIFDTEILILTPKDKKLIIKKDWIFDWHKEIEKIDRQVFRLVIKENERISQGLISISDNIDHLYMHLIESAKFNKGKSKIYLGVPGNLVAFACKHSFDLGYGGYVAFDSKTNLIKHYQDTLGAKWFRGTRMYIDSDEALKLINQYFKKNSHGTD